VQQRSAFHRRGRASAAEEFYISMACSLRMRSAASNLFQQLMLLDLEVMPA
jgi:hypothetical protein